MKFLRSLAALALACFAILATPACALQLPAHPSGIIFLGTPPAPVSGYNPLGALFLQDIGVGTHTTNLTADTPVLSEVFWFKGSFANEATSTSSLNSWQSYNGTGLCEWSGGGGPGSCDSSDFTNGRFQFNYNGTVGTTSADGVNFVMFMPDEEVWHQYAVTFSTVSGAYAVLLDGNAVPAGSLGTMLTGASGKSVNMARPYHVMAGPASASTSYGYMADHMVGAQSWACTGTDAPDKGCTSALATAHDISPLRKALLLASGKPVDPGTGCANPFAALAGSIGNTSNVSPFVCQTGDGAAFGANSGTGQAFVLEKNNGYATPTDATSQLWTSCYGPANPSGITHGVATCKWVNDFTSGVSSQTLTSSSGGKPIAVGDLIIMTAVVTYQSSPQGGLFTCPANVGGKNVWTMVGTALYDGTQWQKSAVCWAFAVAGDTAGAYSMAYGGVDSGTIRNNMTQLIVYSGVASVGNTASLKSPSSSVDYKTPSLTVASGRTFVNILTNWNDGNSSPATTWPGPVDAASTTTHIGTVRDRQSVQSQNVQIMTWDEVIGSSGTYQREVKNGQADITLGYALELVPSP